MSYTSHCKRQRNEKKSIPDNQKDEKYYERRKRNNEAAKKSRDARKIREDIMILRTKILENENEILRKKILFLWQKVETLHILIVEIQREMKEKLNYNYIWTNNYLQNPQHFICHNYVV